ncbi:hypothetical protein EDB81DRAFT_763380 [Dactylonectria macrodidyma]|uniref:Uncharacterized protein n=1 Tax=Dactylonectria macrodidyma TaxID=307937 RepID=A0A9P9E7K1_9HYPO|nr:hypothetical protein EDB81DRAFT_763380 [Dactylonectria macrodidyma]
MVWSRLWEKPFGADGICLEPNQAGDGVRNHMDVHALPSGSSLERTRKFLQFGLDLIRSSSNDSGAKGHLKSFSFGHQTRFEEMCQAYLGLNVREMLRDDVGQLQAPIHFPVSLIPERSHEKQPLFVILDSGITPKTNTQSQLSQPKGVVTRFNRLTIELQEAFWSFSLSTQ